MMIDEMKKFCMPDHPHYGKPFCLDGKTYATNGHIAIVVDGTVPGYEARPPKVETVLASISKAAISVGTVHPVSLSDVLHEVNKKPCPHCGGSGKVKKCLDCNGEGVIVFESDVYCERYEVECRHCEGYGVSDDGEGKEVVCLKCARGMVAEREYVNIGKKIYQFKTLIELNELTGVTICVDDCGTLDPTKFLFPGGSGIVLPARIL